MKIFGKVIDERFLTHRRRSTSIAGIACALTAIGLFEYRYWVNRVWSWELLSIALVFIAVKLALMAWYYLTD